MRFFAVRRLPASAVALAALAALAVAVALAVGDRSAAGSAQAAETNAPTYALLTRAANARDEGFARSSVALSQTATRSPQLGLEPRAARVVRSDDSQTLAVAPATAAPCLIAERRDRQSHVSCGTGKHPATAMVTYGEAVGVVPDAVKAVTFKMTDGSLVTREVKGNLWDAPSEAALVTFVVEGHSTVVELMPRSSLPEGATVGPDGEVTSGTYDPEYRG